MDLEIRAECPPQPVRNQDFCIYRKASFEALRIHRAAVASAGCPAKRENSKKLEKKVYPDLAKRAKECGALILFADEAGMDSQYHRKTT